MEEFTLRFLDPLKDQQSWRQSFALNPKTDVILETAIKLEQKKVMFRTPRAYNFSSLDRGTLNKAQKVSFAMRTRFKQIQRIGSVPCAYNFILGRTETGKKTMAKIE